MISNYACVGGQLVVDNTKCIVRQFTYLLGLRNKKYDFCPGEDEDWCVVEKDGYSPKVEIEYMDSKCDWQNSRAIICRAAPFIRFTVFRALVS